MSQNNRPVTHASPNPVARHWWATILAAVLAVALFAGTSVALLINGLNRQLSNAVVSTAHLPQSSQAPEIPEDGFEGRPVNIFITGIDSRFGDNGAVGAGSTEEFESILTDTNMILHLSADRTSATVVSIPRDMMTTMATCTTADGMTVGGYWAQFNWAFAEAAQGDDIGAGIACTTATAELMSGLTMDGFAIIDFVGFQDLIGTLGGLQICIDEAVEDEEARLAHLEPGCHTLPPDQALAYSRARKNLGTGSDIGRIGRQHQVVAAMAQQVMNANILTDVFKLHAFVQEALNTVSVSPSLGDLTTDMGLLNSVRNIPSDNFRFVTVPWGQDPEDPNRVIESEPLASELWAALQNDASLPPGIAYKDMSNQYFIVGPNGEPVPAQLGEWDDIVPVDPNALLPTVEEGVESDGTEYGQEGWG